MDIYITAFRELRYDRPVGLGVGSILWSSIVKWGELHGMDADDTAILENHIRAMESALDELAEGANPRERTPHV